MDDVAAKEKEIRDFIRRADRTPLPTDALKREALKKLIELAREPQPALKKLAADNITSYLKAFPDLEEDAINAIYDLCEDNDSKVRVDGYRAIVQVSKVQPKWVKRNADVLVQLLQSDEADEVLVVKKALLSHLDLDPQVTFGVLCDHIVPPEDPIDEEERQTRERLRTLVLSFICSQRAITERLARQPGSEEVLISGLFKAIDQFDVSVADKIVKEILINLPSFKGRPSTQGNDLVLRLLKRTTPSLLEDMKSRSGFSTISAGTRDYLDLASFISVERSAASPSHLVNFYCQHLQPSGLGKFAPDSKVFLLIRTAEAFHACNPDEIDRDRVRRHLTDCASALLPGFVNLNPDNERSWKAIEWHFELYLERLDQTRYQINSSTLSAYKNIERLANEHADLPLETVKELTKTLIARYNPNLPSYERVPRSNTRKGYDSYRPQTPSSNRSQSPASRSRSPPSRRSPPLGKRKAEEPSDLNYRSVSLGRRSPQPLGGLRIRGQHARDLPPHLRNQDAGQHMHGASLQGQDDMKRQRTEESVRDRPAYSRTNGMESSARVSSEPIRASFPSDRRSMDPPSGGWNIKGAASRPASSAASSPSLLTRLGSNDPSGFDEHGGRRKKRRGGRR